MNVTGKSIILATILLLALILPRIFGLGSFLTADEVRWQANVAGFTNKLSQDRIGELVQQPHPGITTQWFAAATVFNSDWAIKKIPLVLWHIVIIIIIGYVAWRATNPTIATILTLLLALDPLLIAHTRVYAMDSLMAQFCLLSLLLSFLWNKTKESRYMMFAGAAAAAALLSKLPGVILIPSSIALIIWFQGFKKETTQSLLLWVTGYILGLIIILPSFLIHPLNVIGDFTEFFRSNDYNDLHKEAWWYYLSTLFFFSTPLQMVGLLSAIYFLIRDKAFQYKKEIIALFIFAAGFVAMMSLGLKKGDRYILPSFLMLDTIAAYTAGYIWLHKEKIKWNKIAIAIATLFLCWQIYDVANLNTYILSYVNPITKPWLGDRRMGWGEGLDIAANYLNQKPNAKNLNVASYYPTQFNYTFIGQTKSANQWDAESNDYVVLYRAMLERGNNSWEQDVLNHFKGKTPEKIISLNSIPYVWIYKVK